MHILSACQDYAFEVCLTAFLSLGRVVGNGRYEHGIFLLAISTTAQP